VIRRVLSQYELGAVRAVEALGGAGGFSGAEFWRIDADAGRLCLRRWPPEHPKEAQLRRMHAFLAEAARQQLPVPAPRAARGGETFLRQHGAWWELTAWMPGRADYHQRPRPARLAAAVQTLAQLHQAGEAVVAPAAGRSQILQRRFEMLRETPGLVRRLEPLQPRLDPELAPLAAEVLARAPAAAGAALRLLQDTPRLVTPQQIVIRDIWHDHVLFQDDQVSGVVDFGALAVDTVGADLARLLGSLCKDDREAWQQALAAYEQTRPLSVAERELALVLDRAAVILSGLNWLRWLLLEERQFPDRHSQIAARMQAITARLQRL